VQPAGRVTGLDLSPEMLAAARSRCAHGAVRPGGRVVFAEWAISEPNEWMTLVCDVARRVLGRDDLSRTPDHTRQFADRGALRASLAEAGLAVIDIRAVPEPLWVGRSVGDVLAWFSRLQDSRFPADVAASDRRRYLLALGTELGHRADAGGVHLLGTAWVVHARVR
jgi:SAM-dependent methyltransferase